MISACVRFSPYRPIDRRMPLAQAAERLVHRDARNPGAECRVAAKMLESGEGADIGLLHDVFGPRHRRAGCCAPHGTAGDYSACVMARDGRLVALARAPHQFLVVNLFGGGYCH